jgi:hypothetical protein
MEHSTCRVWSWPLLAWRKRLHKYGENSATMRITLLLPQTVKLAGSASELVMWQLIVSALAECESEDQKTSRGWRGHPTTGRTRSDQRPHARLPSSRQPQRKWRTNTFQMRSLWFCITHIMGFDAYLFANSSTVSSSKSLSTPRSFHLARHYIFLSPVS